jgi:hypothetical protein
MKADAPALTDAIELGDGFVEPLPEILGPAAPAARL